MKLDVETLLFDILIATGFILVIGLTYLAGDLIYTQVASEAIKENSTRTGIIVFKFVAGTLIITIIPFFWDRYIELEEEADADE